MLEAAIVYLVVSAIIGVSAMVWSVVYLFSEFKNGW
jgi:hypothetical protein